MAALDVLIEVHEHQGDAPGHILGEPATMDEVWRGIAQACWTCRNSECKLQQADALMKCTSHVRRDEDKLMDKEFKEYED